MAHPSPPPSARKSSPQPMEMTAKTQRRLIPEPVEISSRSNRALPNKERNPDAVSTGVSRFLPQPIETSTINYKNAGMGNQPHNAADLTSPQPLLSHPIEPHPASSNPRKFAPQLVETTRRRRKSTDIGPTVLPSDKTEVSPGDQSRLLRLPRPIRPSAYPTAPGNTPIASTDQIPGVSESRFSSSNLRKRTEPRRHSFRVPSLPPILSTGDSGGSNESNCPSLSISPSATSDETELAKNSRRGRRSCHEIPTGYLLSQAARAAENQLREQVMAAYPNENMHEPVDHFAIDRETDDQVEEDDVKKLSRDTPKASQEKPGAQRIDSAAGWDLAEIRRHRETLEQQRNKHHTTVQPELDRRRSMRGSFQDPAQSGTNSQQTTGAAKHKHGGRQKDAEMEKMRKAASPPMAGEKLRFPMCQSPQQTRLDIGHHPSAWSNTGLATPKQHSGLWTPGGGASKRGSVLGLWMGTSAAKPAHSTLEPPKNLQTGLLTPETEQDDPFASTSTSYDKHELPLSPPSSQSDSKISCLDSILLAEEKVTREFHDAFVTQVYNYLSLGYPSLARKFDAELSKISKIPIEELRRDDKNTNAKGYVGAPEGSGSDVRGMQQGACARWSALRKYVREWARQQPHMGPRVQGLNGEWGHRARRGSWAI